MIDVRFVYLTGQRRPAFRNARLAGSWNGWTDIPMAEIVAEDGCPAFAATVSFDDGQAGQRVFWGVRLDGPAGANAWGIMTDVQQRQRELLLPGAGASVEARYYLTWSRRLGAQKHHAGGSAPDLRFAVWAPNARAVEVVFATAAGYVADDGSGIDPARPVVPLRRTPGDFWESDPVADFAANVGAPYMFRIQNAQGQTTYRTDIHSRWQIGRGWVDPRGGGWDGDPATLDGRVSCSVVIDQDVVREEFEPTSSPPVTIGDDDFWRDEFTPGLPVPGRIEDLVIYELHVGALGFGRPDTGTLADAMRLLDHLVDLGVNAVELMPLAEYGGNLGWGYGNTHHFAIESSAGGRDKYKHFVRACHQRGIAVLVDVVYNHFAHDADRAEWEYDSTQPEQNIYYWYEGTTADYPYPEGGYLNNGSTEFAPRYWQEPVRQLFISSAVELIEEFHVDGLRVDLTQAIHRDNTVNLEHGWGVSSANVFGQKLLREWSRTLRLFKPSVMLIAEDHSDWPKVTEDPRTDGLGFDSTWFAGFYHALIGDSNMAGGAARLLRQAGFGDDGPLAIQQFADQLWRTQFDKIAYHESHDEAGNSGGTARTSVVAVNHAALVGATRDFAEARCRVACGLAMLSAGTPMFFMGEEILAQRSYRHDNVSQSKEDLAGERAGAGARMFRFYQDLIRMRRANRALRSRKIDIVHASDPNRIIAFTRRDAQTEVLVVASLNNHPFQNGYRIQTDPGRLPAGLWQETFNSDSAIYGGANIGNLGAAIPADNGQIELVIPANALLVLQRR
jgi:1,4-alpha-glucan branching enzyme